MTECNVNDWHVTEITAATTHEKFGIYDLQQRCMRPVVHSLVYHQHILLWLRPAAGAITRSTLQYSAGGSQGNLGPLVFLPAGVELKTMPAMGKFEANVILYRFDPDYISHAPLASDVCTRDMRRCMEIKNAAFSDLLQKMSYESANPSIGSELIIRCLSELLAIGLYRFFNNQGRRAKIRTVGGIICNRSIDQIREFIEYYPDRIPSVQEIALEFGCTSGFLGRAFRETTGEALKDYINRARMLRARRMIEHSDATLDVIAQRVGFSDASTFSRSFAKATGVRPGAYRTSRTTIYA